jgi:hypothetical protein
MGPPRSRGGLGGIVPPETIQHRGQRLVGYLDAAAPPVPVPDRYAVSLGPARQFRPCCHRTSLPNERGKGAGRPPIAGRPGARPLPPPFVRIKKVPTGDRSSQS